MKNDIAKIFRLQAFKIYESVVTEKEVILRAALKKSFIRCPLFRVKLKMLSTPVHKKPQMKSAGMLF